MATWLLFALGLNHPVPHACAGRRLLHQQFLGMQVHPMATDKFLHDVEASPAGGQWPLIRRPLPTQKAVEQPDQKSGLMPYNFRGNAHAQSPQSVPDSSYPRPLSVTSGTSAV